MTPEPLEKKVAVPSGSAPRGPLDRIMAEVDAAREERDMYKKERDQALGLSSQLKEIVERQGGELVQLKERARTILIENYGYNLERINGHDPLQLLYEVQPQLLKEYNQYRDLMKTLTAKTSLKSEEIFQNPQAIFRSGYNQRQPQRSPKRKWERIRRIAFGFGIVAAAAGIGMGWVNYFPGIGRQGSNINYTKPDQQHSTPSKAPVKHEPLVASMVNPTEGGKSPSQPEQKLPAPSLLGETRGDVSSSSLEIAAKKFKGRYCNDRAIHKSEQFYNIPCSIQLRNGNETTLCGVTVNNQVRGNFLENGLAHFYVELVPGSSSQKGVIRCKRESVDSDLVTLFDIVLGEDYLAGGKKKAKESSGAVAPTPPSTAPPPPKLDAGTPPQATDLVEPNMRPPQLLGSPPAAAAKPSAQPKLELIISGVKESYCPGENATGTFKANTGEVVFSTCRYNSELADVRIGTFQKDFSVKIPPEASGAYPLRIDCEVSGVEKYVGKTVIEVIKKDNCPVVKFGK